MLIRIPPNHCLYFHKLYISHLPPHPLQLLFVAIISLTGVIEVCSTAAPTYANALNITKESDRAQHCISGRWRHRADGLLGYSWDDKDIRAELEKQTTQTNQNNLPLPFRHADSRLP